MRVIPLEEKRIEDFLDYCRTYKLDHDESFLSEDELSAFTMEENLTVILIDEKEQIIGAASLLLTPQFINNRKGRFRILHTMEPFQEGYKMMIETIVRQIQNVDFVYAFLPENKQKVGEIFKELGFFIERYSWELRREINDIKEEVFPTGFEIKTFVEGRDEEAWCEIINESFKNIAGHTDITVSDVKVNPDFDEYVKDGMLVLWNEEKAVGVLHLSQEMIDGEKYAYIGPIAILPQYQGKGLGRNLLRASLHFAKKAGFNHSVLTVNAENSKAADLYIAEGFKKTEVFICYKMWQGNSSSYTTSVK